MNVLVLTPDAVGSTLLQRLITVYMQFHDFGKPVINLHELTNGIQPHFSLQFQRNILGKVEWGYHQSLPEIVQLLQSTDHFKTARLAQYHILARGDSLEHQQPFYSYLNKNFFIIQCRRNNVFEHALSWALNKVTKRLNVYRVREKINAFADIYAQGIDIDQISMTQCLDTYRKYLAWCDQYFGVQQVFEYETDIPRIENFILDLPIWPQDKKITWHDRYNIDFNDWNRCHYLYSDIGALAMSDRSGYRALGRNLKQHGVQRIGDTATLARGIKAVTDRFINDYNNVKSESWPEIRSIEDFENLPVAVQQECVQTHGLKHDLAIFVNNDITDLLPRTHQNFIAQHQASYRSANAHINDLCKQGVLLGGPPIKKQTLAEKKFMIRNFDQCVATYNDWANQHPEVAAPISHQDIDRAADRERRFWQPDSTALSAPDQRTTAQLGYQNGDDL